MGILNHLLIAHASEAESAAASGVMSLHWYGRWIFEQHDFMGGSNFAVAPSGP